MVIGVTRSQTLSEIISAEVAAIRRQRFQTSAGRRTRYPPLPKTPTKFHDLVARFLITMDLPTSREIELETLLRQRDAQVAELTVSFFRLSTRAMSVA